MAAVQRQFQDRPAVRTATPLLFGVAGPSGSGKTFSALRLATGMQRVTGGDIFLIDTESSRALHYAELFRFRHVPFDPPFSSDDYIAAIEHCVKQGGKIIVVDSMSHEHEGPGGLLEWHEAEIERLKTLWKTNDASKVQMTAWAKPKAARRKLIQAILQAQCNFVFCFRAKNKIKVQTGKGKTQITQMGFMPIAGEEFVYELTAKALLLPGAGGVPTLQSDEPGEQMMVKVPEQFRGIFTGSAGKPLDESIGEQMARWAAGEGDDENGADDLRQQYEKCTSQADFDNLEKQRAAAWGSLTAPGKKALKAASDTARIRIEAANEAAGFDEAVPHYDTASAVAELEEVPL